MVIERIMPMVPVNEPWELTMEQTRARPLQMSEDQFLAWAETHEGRYELVEGVVMMQAGATRDHERVAKRVFALLYAQVDESTFDVNKGDFGVRIRPGSGNGSILYPDVLVDLQSEKGSERATTTPVVVIEVLSESTDYDHHVAKLDRYRTRETLRQYVILDQKEPRAYIWSKTDAGWPAEPERVERAGGIISFPWIGATLRMAEVYRSTEPHPEPSPN
jgi:Uma2 family endonuclease